MASFTRFIAAGMLLLGVSSSAMAQVSAAEAEQIHVRQQIATMEQSLFLAVVHGVDNVYAQFRSVFQDRPRLGSQPRVTGFILPGYGPTFMVDVPMIQVPLLYEVLVRDQEYRTAAMNIQRMRNDLNALPPGPERNQQEALIRQLEQDLSMGNLRAIEPQRNNPRGSTTLVPRVPAGVTTGLVESKPQENPESVYTRAVKDALMDAMLTNSQGLSIGPDEWLTIMAKASDSATNSPTPGDTVDSTKGTIRVKGSVLAAYRAGTITREEARSKFEVKEQ